MKRFSGAREKSTA